MSRDDIREALLLLEEPGEASPEFRQALLQRFIGEATAEERVQAPERPAPPRLRRPRWLSVKMVPAVAVVVAVALLGAFFLLVPQTPSAWAALERARDRFERQPFHATISNSAAVFDADLNTVMEIEVVEHWFESETRWRSTTLSHNFDPHLAGSFSVTDGEKLGRYFSENNTFAIQPASEIDDPYLESGLGFHDPTLGVWFTDTGIKPTPQFLDENCRVSEDRIAGRTADKLACKTGLEGDTMREASFWLDHETGFILKLETFSCGTVEGERRCGQEAVREVKSIEFKPSFPDGTFDVTAPEGSTVREAEPFEARSELDATIEVDVDPVRIRAELGAIWVGGQTGREGAARLLRIDSSTNSVVATIEDAGVFAVGGDELPRSPTTGEYFVWVVSGNAGSASLQRLDPDTNRFTGTPVPLGPLNAQDIATGEGAIWVVGGPDEGRQESGELLRIDPATNEVRRTTLDGYPIRVSLGAGSAWVTASFQPADPSAPPTVRIHKVDARTGRVEGTVRPQGIVVPTFGEGALWTLTVGGRAATLTKIDPATLRELGTIDLPADRYSAQLTTSYGLVWVLNYDAGTLTRIDPTAIQVVGDPIRYGRGGGQAFAIADGNRTAWVGMWAGVGRGTLVRIDVRRA